MAMKVKLNVPYPIREHGVRRIAKPGEVVLLHSHLAAVEHRRGKVRILGQHVAPAVAARWELEQEKKAKKKAKGEGKRKRGRPRKNPLPEAPATAE